MTTFFMQNYVNMYVEKPVRVNGMEIIVESKGHCCLHCETLNVQECDSILLTKRTFKDEH